MAGVFVKSLDQSLWIYSKILPYIRGKNSRVGNEHHIQCPFCNEAVTSSHPSTAMRGYYFIDKQNYYCFRCQEWHTAFELYEKLSGLSRKDLLPEYLEFINKHQRRGTNFSNFLSTSADGFKTFAASGANLQTTMGDNVDRVPIPERMKAPLTERGRKYLESRKIFESPNLPPYAKFYSSVYCSPRSGNKPYEVVVIPWYLDGEVWTYQWRFLDKDVPLPKYGFPKNNGKKIYGIDSISTTFPYIICCEGVFDSLFVKNGIAVGGKSVSDSQRAMLKERFPSHRLVYGFDNDMHGINAMFKSSGNSNDSLIFYWKDVSKGFKDLNDYAVGADFNYFFDEGNVLKHIYNPAHLRLKLNNPFKS